MLRLHDSASSGNAYKVRLLLTQLGHPVRAHRIRHRPRRDAHARVPGAKTPTAASRCWSWTTGAACRSRTRSSGTWPRGRRICPAPTSERAVAARAGAAVDVLRAVQPRAQHRDRSLLDHAQGGDDAERVPPLPGKRKWGDRGARGDGAATCTTAASSSASATRSPTSRSTRTPTSPRGRLRPRAPPGRARVARARCRRAPPPEDHRLGRRIRSPTRSTVHFGRFLWADCPLWPACGHLTRDMRITRGRIPGVRRASGPARSGNFRWRPRCCWR